jgi:hypothetical protein
MTWWSFSGGGDGGADRGAGARPGLALGRRRRSAVRRVRAEAAGDRRTLGRRERCRRSEGRGEEIVPSVTPGGLQVLEQGLRVDEWVDAPPAAEPAAAPPGEQVERGRPGLTPAEGTDRRQVRPPASEVREGSKRGVGRDVVEVGVRSGEDPPGRAGAGFQGGGPGAPEGGFGAAVVAGCLEDGRDGALERARWNGHRRTFFLARRHETAGRVEEKAEGTGAWPVPDAERAVMLATTEGTTRATAARDRVSAGGAAALVNARWVVNVEEQLRRVDELRVQRPALVVFQNAPPNFDPDGRALPPGAATTAATRRKWALVADHLERSVFVNALREPPRHYADAAGEALRRLEYLLVRVVEHERRPVSGLVLAGAVQRDALQRLAGPVGGARLEWNRPYRLGGVPVVVVPHTSGLNRLYNPGHVGEASGALVRPMLGELASQPWWAAQAEDLRAA